MRHHFLKSNDKVSYQTTSDPSSTTTSPTSTYTDQILTISTAGQTTLDNILLNPPTTIGYNIYQDEEEVDPTEINISSDIELSTTMGKYIFIFIVVTNESSVSKNMVLFQ